jgi:formylmethanofuran dehydrogenase subunit E
MEEILKKVDDQELRSQMERVAQFHGYLSTGAFIGIQMYNIARRLLEVSNGENTFVTCETYNCLPDPFQVLAGSTIGNKRLKIDDRGKMAVTISKRVPKGKTKVNGIRIILDPAKTVNYPKLHAWYMKRAKVPHEEVVPLLLEAGESVYSYQMLELKLPDKPRKKIEICGSCGESFIQKADEMHCSSCLELK